MWCRALLASSLLALAASSARAQELNWAEKMFDKLSVDFGTVARGAECTHRLKIKNIYQETIYIRNVHTSCGCAAARPSSDQIPSGKEVYLELSMDTTRYMRQRDSNALITLTEPTKGLSIEVRIPLKVYIRTDVVFTPGAVNFGAVDQGAGSERKISVAYAGRNDWRILEVTSPKPYLTAKAVETGRSGNGTANYDLIVTLKPDAPVGVLRDLLTLVTDDQNSPHVPLQVDGRVEAEFTVSPESIALGAVAPGSTRTYNVVVRGRRPFKIEGIECSTSLECFKVVLPSEEKLVHVLPLKFTAPEEAVEINELFTITIPGRPEPVTFKAQGKVAGATSKGT
jgi:hypothetical protein